MSQKNIASHSSSRSGVLSDTFSGSSPDPLPSTISPTSFVHLRLHSEYSLVDGTVAVRELASRVRELGMPAVAITDVSNLFALVKFYRAAQANGVKPICGCDFQVQNEAPDQTATTLTLLVQNELGYKNLTRLISKSYLDGQVQGKPTVRREWVTELSDGLIALSGFRGDMGQALISGRIQQAVGSLQQWQSTFPDRFYLELSRTGRAGEEAYLHAAVAMAAEHDCPVVATNDVRFLASTEYEAHEARVCISEGRTLEDPRRERRYSEQQYLRSPEEMCELFEDIPEAIVNSVEIAKRCTLELELDSPQLPDYPVPEGLSTEEFFRELAVAGLEKRLASLSTGSSERSRDDYFQRLDLELGIINQMGFAGYFLIVMDFIRWAKDNDIPVGPGRGSGAGSLVAYALDITGLDPLEYDLLFERFLNPERVSMPDFDIDFCMDNRDRVIAYVAERYGRDAVSQIITFGTMAAKAVVRDVARVQGKAYGLADKLSKMIPLEIGMTLKKAREQESVLSEFLDQDEEAQEIWAMALQLEGITRNAGKHAGGVVIAPTQLTDFSPLFCDEAGTGVVTQFDKDDVEAVGLVKFDFLGLRTLTIIDWAVKRVNQRRAADGLEAIDIETISLNDQPTYELMQRAETTAVFQLESRGMKDLIKRQLPSCFEDIIALVALFRPGPLQSGMVDDFINRKHGREEVAYPHHKYQHEALKPVLEPTYGIILYQEQVMQIAQVLGGYTLGGADVLRRAMGKKKPEEMAKQREIFQSGAAKNGIDPRLAENIFDLMEKFAGYGFNKSHSAAYALLAYQTAWLKVHYPAEFMASVLSAEMQNTDKIVILKDECSAMNLALSAPDVNISEFQFGASDTLGVVYGLGAIKGLGEGPVESITAARQKGGPFKDLFDFCSRVDGRKINKRALEALIRAGALDSVGPSDDPDYSRAVMLAAMDEAIKLADQQSRNLDAGMTDLFGDTLAASAPEIGYAAFTKVRRFSLNERLQGEQETLGLYFSAHPVDQYRAELEHVVSSRIKALKPTEKNQTVAGLLVAVRSIKTRRGDVMGILTLDDNSARMDVTVFAEQFQQYRDKISKGTVLVVNGPVTEDEYTGGLKMRAEQINTLLEAREAALKGLLIDWRAFRGVSTNDAAGSHRGNGVPGRGKCDLESLGEILKKHSRGSCPMKIRLSCKADADEGGAQGDIILSDEWSVNPNDELLHHLRDAYGEEYLQLEY